MKPSLFFVLLSILLAFHARAITIEEVPNPKDTGAYYVSDPDHLLSDGAINQLNSMLWQLENTSEFQAAVVVLNDLGDQEPKDFATRLFNYWGIGKKSKDNGFLLLVAMKQRRMEMETGYGTETVLPDIVCFNIQQEYMVPLFKEGNYEEGILEGMKQVVKVLDDPSAANSILEKEDTGDGAIGLKVLLYVVAFPLLVGIIAVYIYRKEKKLFNTFNIRSTLLKQNSPVIASYWWLLIYAFLPAYICYLIITTNDSESLWWSIYLLGIFYSVERFIRINYQVKKYFNDPYDLYVVFKKLHAFIALYALIFPVPMAIYFIFYKKRQHKLRNIKRICQDCSCEMHKLDESSDDDFLKEGQVREEEIKSVDYDVWLCSDCGNYEVFQYQSSNTKYSECKHCSFVTRYLESKKTVRAATYSSSGRGLIIYACKNCAQKEKEYYSIARLQRSSSSSSYGGGSSSFSGSGSSFGGGMSGGGGAGSSW